MPGVSSSFLLNRGLQSTFFCRPTAPTRRPSARRCARCGAPRCRWSARSTTWARARRRSITRMSRPTTSGSSGASSSGRWTGRWPPCTPSPKSTLSPPATTLSAAWIRSLANALMPALEARTYHTPSTRGPALLPGLPRPSIYLASARKASPPPPFACLSSSTAVCRGASSSCSMRLGAGAAGRPEERREGRGERERGGTSTLALQ